MTEVSISHRDRVNLALAHKSADRVPMDFAAEPKVWQKLMDYFGTSSKEDILQRLDVDCRIISYDFEVFCRPGHLPAVEKPGCATWRHTTEQGIKADIWGARRRYIKNEFAEYEELCDYPLSNAESIDDLKKYN